MEVLSLVDCVLGGGAVVISDGSSRPRRLRTYTYISVDWNECVCCVFGLLLIPELSVNYMYVHILSEVFHSFLRSDNYAYGAGY